MFTATYVYQLVKGDVLVHYVDTEGNTIASDVVDMNQAPVNDAYDTTDHKPSEIAYNGHVYRIIASKTEGVEEGKVVETTTNVTYVYELVRGDVIVHYVDTEGHAIATDVVDTKQAPVNDAYDTTDHKTTEISYDGHLYRINQALTTGQEKGIVSKNTTEVTYVYDIVRGDVLVHYVDTEGNTIASDVVDTKQAPVNDAYDTTDHKPSEIVYDGHLYRINEKLTKGNEVGKVIETTTNVTYVYQLIKGDVLVHYVDTEGNTIASDVVDTDQAPVNDAYDTTDHKPTEISYDGHVYRIITDKTKGNEKGVVTEDTTNVTYVYQLIKGDVLVHYVDAEGNTIASDVIDTDQAPVNDAYDTTDHKPTEISYDGHVYRIIPSKTKGAEKGKVTEDATNVTYVYDLVRGDVIVHYVDVEGNTIASDVVDTKQAPVNDAYDTTDHKSKEIEYGGHVYRIIPSKTEGAEKGAVTEATTEVTYVYDLVRGDVLVHYVDTEGNTIATDVVDTKQAPVNDAYDTTDHKPYEIAYDGHVYRIVSDNTKGNESC